MGRGRIFYRRKVWEFYFCRNLWKWLPVFFVGKHWWSVFSVNKVRMFSKPTGVWPCENHCCMPSNCWCYIFIIHPRPPGRHIAIDSWLLILSFELKFLCADMFPYEDFKTVSVCPYPEKINHPENTFFFNFVFLLLCFVNYV